MLREYGLGPSSVAVDPGAGTGGAPADFAHMLHAAGFDIAEAAYERSVYAAWTCVRR